MSAVDGRCLLLPSSPSPNGASTGNCADSAWSQIAFQRYPLLFETGAPGTTLTVGAVATNAELAMEFLDGTTWRSLADLLPLSKIEMRFAGVSLNSGVNQMRVIFPDGSVAYAFTVTWQRATVYPGTGFE